MSLILEALKKSEQQRRIGQVPNLGTPVLVTRRRRSLLPIILVLVVVAVAAGAWLHFSSPTDNPGPDKVAATTDDAALKKLPPGDKPAAATPATTPVSTVASMPATARTGESRQRTHPDRPLSAYERQRLKVTGELPPSAFDSKPVHPARTAVAPPRPATPASSPAVATPPPVGTKPGTKPAAHTPTVTPPAAAPAKLRTAPAVATPATPTPAVAESSLQANAPTAAKADSVPYLWELPFATRQDMPPLQISMHVYAEVPADRLVVIDGDSFGEGDEISEGLIVKEIRPDGVVLDLDGTLFLLAPGGR